MPSLAEKLSITTPVSPLLRKARRLGLAGVDGMIALAGSRGCLHYARSTPEGASNPFKQISNEELTILLLVGENPYSPDAIRCAAQLARSPEIRAHKLAKLAVMEKCERTLAHIALAGVEHDDDGLLFWQDLLDLLPTQPEEISEGVLPHWSRFVSMPGIQRGGMAKAKWLTPRLQ